MKNLTFKKNIGLDYFNTFKVVIDVGSFSNAAKILMSTEGAVRHRVNIIESYLGSELLIRNGKGVKPTSFGYQLYDNINNLEKFITILDDMRKSRSVLKEKSIKICGGEIAVLEVLPKIVKRFGKIYKDTEISIETSNAKDCMKKIFDGDIDIAIVGKVNFPEFLNKLDLLEVYDIFETSLCIAVPASHKFASYNSIDISKVKTENFIRRSEGSATQAILDNILGKDSNSQSKFRLEMSSSSALLNAISLGLGIGIVSEVQAKNFNKRNKIKIIKLDDNIVIRLKIAIKKSESRSAIRNFLEMTKNINDVNTTKKS